jgi:hypothetical protein
VEVICEVTSCDGMGVDAIAVPKFSKWLTVYGGMLCGQKSWLRHYYICTGAMSWDGVGLN